MPADDSAARPVTAAMLIIGNEVLSGRTQDANLAHFAKTLGARGITLKEARVVADEPPAIIEAVNALRRTYDLVFTTGGIGPTHDDITADCIAQAFGVSIAEDPRALAVLTRYYGAELNPGRRRMARVPKGSSLIANPVSGAPGFFLENVYVMAGVPSINRAMLNEIIDTLPGGAPRLEAIVSAPVAEGSIADALRAIAARYPNVEIGSYPNYAHGKFGTSIVLKSTDARALASAKGEVMAMMRKAGGEPMEGDPEDKVAAGEPGGA
jgi:molybdenum cofactor synthesis domain-containing protein